MLRSKTFAIRALPLMCLGLWPLAATAFSAAETSVALSSESEARASAFCESERTGGGLHPMQSAPALIFDISQRAKARAYYRAIHNASEGTVFGWTGSIGGVPGVNVSGWAGTTSEEFKADVLLRINWFRAMAGVPADVQFSDVYSAKAQQAAFMMAANSKLDHNPPTTWLQYSADGAEAAARSNLALGTMGPAAISGYMMDSGTGNTAVGHRRWLLYPQTRTMGTGDTPAYGSFLAANATWVMDGNFGTARPGTRTPYVAWPPAGHVPYQTVYPRWSFALPNADFSAASVSLTRDGVPVSVSLEPLQEGAGESTLVWSYLFDGAASASANVTHPKPQADVVYGVQVSGVRVDGQVKSYSYTVTVFDPYTESTDASDDPAKVLVSGVPGVFTVNQPSYATGFQWRTVLMEAAADHYGAEGDMQGIEAETSSGYAVLQAGIAAEGNSSYHLAHFKPATQLLRVPGSFYVTGSPATLNFQSRLGAATTQQAARVQVSVNKGRTWTDLYTQAGVGQPGETGFRARSVSLDALAGKTFQVRFAYTVGTGSYYNQTYAGMGWYIDDIHFSGVSEVTLGETSELLQGDRFTAGDLAEHVGLQARSVLFDAYPLEWGPVLLDAGAAPGARGRLSNLSVRSLVGTGDQALIAGFVVTGGSKPVLVRGVGPTLGAFGVTGVLQDPEMQLVASGSATPYASNDNWGNASNAAEVVAKSKELYAFALESGSRDSAMLTSLGQGGYTARVSGVGGTTGIALAEVYDADPVLASRLVNLSARTQVGTGENVLVIGFVVSGGASQKVLIRAVGPTLSNYGVSDALANPQLVVFNAKGREVARNDDWGGAAELASAAAKVGAFALAADSRDAMLLLTLAPGTYTAQVSGVAGVTGVALAEVYEVND